MFSSSKKINTNNSELLYKKPDGYKNVNAQSYIIIVNSHTIKSSYLKSCSVS